MTTTTTTPRAGTALITGATGAIGGALVDALRDSAVGIRALTRRPDQVAGFRADGVDAVLGSFDDAAGLRTAMAGCDQLFLLAPDGPGQFEGDRTAIDAAVDAGVRHVVKISTSDANPDSAIPWARDHARADEHLQRSGLAWTRLQPGSFMKNLLTEAPAIRRGWLPQTSGHGATAWVDVDDIAAVAARVLTDRTLQGGSGTRGRSYRLTGTPATSYPEIAGILTAELGRRVRYLHLPAPLFYVALRASGTSAFQARGLVHQFVDVVRRGQDDGRRTSTAVEDILGRAPVTLADFVRRHRDGLGAVTPRPAAMSPA